MEKVSLTRKAAELWRENGLDMADWQAPESIPVPGRPDFPELVAPNKVPRRSVKSPEGRSRLVHALAHIEFNAINLAWDAVYRFRHMPREYIDDWVLVAEEEAYHFSLLCERLEEMGCRYGDLKAHNGLWEMACKTDHDVMLRMALVPRVLEARGLDVTPGMMERLLEAGDTRTVSILEIILRDEIGHVAIGSRWFAKACADRGLDPETEFKAILEKHMKGHVKGPFHEVARLQAGFSKIELDQLKQQAGIHGK
jgi:uncharacterized ferritin-like protein (DUF455 family)